MPTFISLGINSYNHFYGSKVPFSENKHNAKLHGLEEIIPTAECTELIRHAITMTSCPTPHVGNWSVTYFALHNCGQCRSCNLTHQLTLSKL